MLAIIFDDNLRIIPILLFVVADFNLLSCELDNFTFTLLYRVIFILKLYQSKINL